MIAAWLLYAPVAFMRSCNVGPAEIGTVELWPACGWEINVQSEAGRTTPADPALSGVLFVHGLAAARHLYGTTRKDNLWRVPCPGTREVSASPRSLSAMARRRWLQAFIRDLGRVQCDHLPELNTVPGVNFR